MRIEHLMDCEEHLATVADWQQAEFGYLNPAVTLEQRRSRLAESLQRTGLPVTLVALSDDGLPVGAACVLAKTLTHAQLSPWLSMVVVPPACRGQGIASALSLRALAEAARWGFKTLHLFTPHNEALYGRLGWETFDRASHQGLPITLMARPTGF